MLGQKLLLHEVLHTSGDGVLLELKRESALGLVSQSNGSAGGCGDFSDDLSLDAIADGLEPLLEVDLKKEKFSESGKKS